MKSRLHSPAAPARMAHLLAHQACLRAALGLLAAVALWPPPARAAVTEAWVHRYSSVVSNSNDQAVKIVSDAAGNIIVTGSTDDGITGPDMLTIKYSGADGSVIWQKRYNGPANRDDLAQAVAVDGSGNVVVTGYSYGTNSFDYYTIKYAAANGALLWEKRYDGPAINSDDKARAVAVDGSGNVVVTGYSYNATNANYYTAKYAAVDGALLWEQRYNGPENRYDQAYAVAVDASGNVVVTGSSGSYPDYDYYTAKYAAANGALLWQKRYNGPASDNGQAQAVAVDGSGDVVVTGSSNNGTTADYYTAKYAAADGALLWEKRYNGPAHHVDEATAVAVDGSGNVVVTGSSFGSGSGFDCYTAKYAAADGALLWEQRYNGGPANNDDSAKAVAVDSSGNVVVTGTSYNGTNDDYYTAKYAAADGALLWEQRYGGAASSYDSAQVAVDGSNNVVMTGSSGTIKFAAADGALLWVADGGQAVAVDASGNVVVVRGYPANDYYTTKYAAANGALLWEQHYDGPGSSFEQAKAVAVDASGNVVVTGTSYNGTNYDYYTAKYAAADGTLLWEKRSEGGGEAVAVDGSGNVVVTGSFSAGLDPFGDPTADYYTAKYAAVDGALLWEQHYNGPSNSFDYATAVAVDASGNVVVTGSCNGGYYVPSDYCTVKYAAADGALLWEKRYSAPAYSGFNNFDYATAVAVDGSGNVVVTGTTDCNGEFCGTGADYYTAKYAAVDGALLWEKRYSGPGNGHEYAPSLALGPNGMVVVTGTSSRDYATVVYRDDVYPISIALVPTGIRLRFTGIPGRSYTIERAPDVTGPWTTLHTQTAPASGLLEYLDAPPPPDQAFYRTVQR